MIYLDKLSRIDAAIKNKARAKFFHRDKIGQTCLFAFDESKRMLAVYASARVSLAIIYIYLRYQPRFPRCNSMSSYSMKNSSLYGDWGPQ